MAELTNRLDHVQPLSAEAVRALYDISHWSRFIDAMEGASSASDDIPLNNWCTELYIDGTPVRAYVEEPPRESLTFDDVIAQSENQKGDQRDET